MYKKLTTICLAAAVWQLGVSPAAAWWGHGHGILTRAAIAAAPEDLPAFFRAGGATAAHLVYDADLFKNRATPHLNNAEHGEHFFDIELLEGHPWPDTRYEFLQHCAEKGLDPARVGTLPYALAEWAERLSVAFAEYRQWPDEPILQAKCLVYAGMLAHYAQDMVQPLHVTVDFDGRKMADGTVVGKGIHEQVDGLIEKLALDPGQLAQGAQVQAFTELMPAIRLQIEASHSLVDRVYALQEELAAKKSGPQVKEFAIDRGVAATSWLASLYGWAWRHSAAIKLPGWHQR